MGEYYQPEREIAPGCELPKNIDLAVWHYMDFWKFVSLIQKRAIYLCRGDNLQDKFEGTYSNRQIHSMNEWFKDIDEPIRVEWEEEERRNNRKKAFINCWCISDVDLDLMWKAYTTADIGVALRSTIRKLQSACDKAIELWPLDICQVKYFDHEKGQNINYWGAPNVFMHKDHHFRLDNEIRIIHYANYSTPPDHVDMPIDFEAVIETIVTRPGTTEDQLESIVNLMQSYGIKIPVVHSRDDRPLTE
jgi:hypothetical protein